MNDLLEFTVLLLINHRSTKDGFWGNRLKTMLEERGFKFSELEFKQLINDLLMNKKIRIGGGDDVDNTNNLFYITAIGREYLKENYEESFSKLSELLKNLNPL